jgi:hypothetical protein
MDVFPREYNYEKLNKLSKVENSILGETPVCK